MTKFKERQHLPSLYEPVIFRDYASELTALERNPDTDLKHLEWRCRNVVLQAISSGEEEPMSMQEIDGHVDDMTDRVNKLISQRTCLKEQIARRLFKPFGGDAAVSREPTPWRISGSGSTDVCYPVRISGLHGDIAVDHFAAMLHQTLDILPHEIVLYSTFNEVDTTRTIELGLRYCEDAFHIRVLLHGVEVDDRLLEVQFLHWISNKVHALSYPLHPTPSETRRPKLRLLRAIALNAVPSLDGNLAMSIYRLERDITSWILSKELATNHKVELLKMQQRRPLQNGK
jgi:hypothetical protein